MHEMSLAEGVLQIVENTARAQGLQRVTELRLEIGKLSSVEPDALRFCLEVVLKGSLADAAQVEFIEVPGQGWCMQCASDIPVEALFDPCPRCGSYQIEITAGREMRIKDLLAE